MKLETPIDTSKLKDIVIDDTLSKKINVLNESGNDSNSSSLNDSFKNLELNDTECEQVNKISWRES